MLPYSFSQTTPQTSIVGANFPLLAMDRLRMAATGLTGNNGLEGLATPSSPFPMGPPFPIGLDPNTAFMFAAAGYRPFDPRGRFIQDEPKPQHSYIGLIAMAILSHSDQKLVLSDIYQWILDNYPYFRTRGPGWRNSIRHNLSLNDCFIKSGRSANGKGHYWAIHPANVEDFKRGDFRRRRAQRKARKAMGYQVGDDDEDDDCEPMGTGHAPMGGIPDFRVHPGNFILAPQIAPGPLAEAPNFGPFIPAADPNKNGTKGPFSPRKRQFDVESLLAPEPTTADDSGFEADNTNMSQFLMGLSAGQYGMIRANMAWPGFQFAPFNPFSSPGRGVPEDKSPEVSPNTSAGSTQETKEPDEKRNKKTPSPHSVEQWQETFAKIMARSYQNRQMSQSTTDKGEANNKSMD